MPESARTVTATTAFRGRLLRVQVERVHEPLLGGGEGPEVRREVVRHPGAAAIVAIDDDRRVVLVRQYRYAVDEVLLEIPAGTLEPGEVAADTAVRELAEETGYRAADITPLGTVFTAPGFCDEALALFRATGLTPGPAGGDEGEDLEVVHLPLDEAARMLATGAFRDAKTVAGLARVLAGDAG